MKRRIEVVLVVLTALLVLGAPRVWGQDDDDDDDEDQATLLKALPQARVSLEQALVASEHEGTPISAKFEMEDGKLQLSVYTMKGDKFFEVVVDHVGGKVVKVEAITSGGDLAAAKAQSEAMTKAKKSLRSVVAGAVTAHEGFRAFNVEPALKDGHPSAEISLAKGDETKDVTVTLE
ncbi:MAG TPA: PepSY domain-containing protein [Verrucomicrobiae bacterium]|nr:PepSY domain-containing protein [Verrucomicrobiae bacterium]